MATIIFEEGHGSCNNPNSVHHQGQLLNNVVDGLAKTFPQALYAEIPATSTYESGYRRVTYASLANAINGAAWWICEQLGPVEDFQTLCYMGWNDIRYVVMVLGAVKAGYKLLLTSPRNSSEGNKRLLKSMNCQVLLTTDPCPPSVPIILEAAALEVYTIPSTNDLLDQAYAHFPYHKTFEQARNEPLVALHTSGTTGFPKPVIYTHDFAAANTRMLRMAPPIGFESMEKMYNRTRVFMLLPPFHSSSMFGPLMEAISNQTIIIFPLATATPSVASLAEALKYTSIDTAVLPPPMVMEIATNATLLETLSRKFDVLFFGGGDLPQSFGDILTTRFKFWTSNGSTETGPYPLIRISGDWPTEDWKYNRVHPAAGLEYRHHIDDLYEAYIVRNSDPRAEQPVFKLYPELQEYATRDLFSRHPDPTKSDLWTFRGRADDMINLQSGTINPTHMDHAVAAHPKIRDALMVPVGKFATERFACHTGLLIELKEKYYPLSFDEATTFEAELKRIVEEANKYYRLEAQVSCSHIVGVDPKKPLPRNLKGMVQRRQALELYSEELGAL